MSVARPCCLPPALAGCGKAAAPGAPGPPRGFLVRNAKAAGVHRHRRRDCSIAILHSGPAGGLRPQPADEVKVDYEGKLLDGQVFDSSYARGAPVVMTCAIWFPAGSRRCK